MLLQGKRLLVTGVLTPQSIAFAVAKVAQEQGAEIVLTSFGKAMSLTERTARRLPLVSAWLRRNLSRGRLAFVRRFDDGAGGDWLFAVTRVHSNWRSYRVPAQDPMNRRIACTKAFQ